MSTFESSIKQIPHSQESVYRTLSDLNNLQRFRERFEQMKGQLSAEQLQQMEQLKNLQFDADSVSVQAPMVGEVKLRIIDREELKTIKFETEKSPIPCNFWIQLLPTSETSCKMKLTLKADIPFMLKGMVKKPLEEGIEKIAEALAHVPYED